MTAVAPAPRQAHAARADRRRRGARARAPAAAPAARASSCATTRARRRRVADRPAPDRRRRARRHRLGRQRPRRPRRGARGGRPIARAAPDRLLAAAGRGRRRLGLDRERRRRQRHAPEPAGPGRPRSADRHRADAIDVAVGPDGAWVTNGQAGPSRASTPSPTACSAHRSAPATSRPRWRSAPTTSGSSTRVTGPSRASTRASTSSSAAACRSAATRRTSRSGSARSGSPTAATARHAAVRVDGRAQGPPIRLGGAPGALAITRDARAGARHPERRGPARGPEDARRHPRSCGSTATLPRSPSGRARPGSSTRGGARSHASTG